MAEWKVAEYNSLRELSDGLPNLHLELIRQLSGLEEDARSGSTNIEGALTTFKLVDADGKELKYPVRLIGDTKFALKQQLGDSNEAR